MAKEENRRYLTPEEEAEYENLKDIIRNGRPIDENHPGFENLNPEQKKRFKELYQLRESGQPLNAEQLREMAKLEDIIINGVPIDENHPGFVMLDPD